MKAQRAATRMLVVNSSGCDYVCACVAVSVAAVPGRPKAVCLIDSVGFKCHSQQSLAALETTANYKQQKGRHWCSSKTTVLSAVTKVVGRKQGNFLHGLKIIPSVSCVSLHFHIFDSWIVFSEIVLSSRNYTVSLLLTKMCLRVKGF